MSKPKVAIVTNFAGADQSYSLVNVVRVQIEMLVNSGYNPVVFVAETFPDNLDGVWSGSQVEIRRVGLHQDSAERIAEKYREALKDIDVALCHDMVFLGNYKVWGDAVRIVAEEMDVAWIHWQHSRGDGSVEPCAKSYYAYPNSGDLGHVARLNQTELERVRYIPHPLDYVYLDWPDLAIRIAEDTGHPWADVAIVYPSRLDRQKQLEKIVRIAAGIKRTGKTVSVIFADAMATGDHFIQYKKEVMQIAKEQGVEQEVTFLGETYEECKYGTPRRTVKALYEMSNLFIQPSTAETSSLVVMEAALAGNLLVLNADFKPILHLYGKALTFEFGSVTQTERGEKLTEYYRNVPVADGSTQQVLDPQAYWDDNAKKIIVPVLDSQLTLAVKRQQLLERWPRRVFDEYLEPLIDEAWKATRPKVSAVTEVLRGDPDVTAIVTTLDNLPILEQQIEILQNEVARVIVVNNGSIDGTAEWLDENVHRYPNLYYVNRENLGAGPGRNEGLRMWGNSTRYTLMVDGGILPPIGGVKQLKKFLEDHPNVHVVSPEVASCFTTEKSKATLIAPELSDDLKYFPQRALSSTAYCLARAEAWDVRFREDGPFGRPGWGVDDNQLAYDWDIHGIVHLDFTHKSSGWLLYRRQSGSFDRLFKETGIYPNQYGSVYEQRNLVCWHDYPRQHRHGISRITKSYIVKGIDYPELARIVKQVHDANYVGGLKEHEVIVYTDGLSDETLRWLEQVKWRWHWGDVQIDADGNIIRRNPENEELWTGDIILDAEPKGEVINVGEHVLQERG